MVCVCVCLCMSAYDLPTCLSSFIKRLFISRMVINLSITGPAFLSVYESLSGTGGLCVRLAFQFTLYLVSEVWGVRCLCYAEKFRSRLYGENSGTAMTT